MSQNKLQEFMFEYRNYRHSGKKLARFAKSAGIWEKVSRKRFGNKPNEDWANTMSDIIRAASEVLNE